MKNQKIIIVVVGLILLIVASGGYFVLSSKKEPLKTVVVKPQLVEESVNTLSPQDIGLILTATPDNRKVIMEINNIEDISSLDYELSYTAKGNIPRGVIGQINVKGKPVKQEIVLGTCSDVCHYDQEVSNIKLVIKATKLGDKVYSVEKNLAL